MSAYSQQRKSNGALTCARHGWTLERPTSKIDVPHRCRPMSTLTAAMIASPWPRWSHLRYPRLLSHSLVWSSNMPANRALITAHGLFRLLRSKSPRPIALSHEYTYFCDGQPANILWNAADVLLHQIASWQFERNRSSLLFSLRYGFLQLSLGAMNRADRNAGLSRDRAHACSAQFATRLGELLCGGAFQRVLQLHQRLGGKEVRRHMLRARKRKGFGWTRWSRQWLYETLRLFNGYRIRRPLPKVALMS